MTEILAFFNEHWFLAFCVIGIIGQVLTMPFRIANRICRSRNIVAQGWPPPHCDADGDFKSVE